MGLIFHGFLGLSWLTISTFHLHVWIIPLPRSLAHHRMEGECRVALLRDIFATFLANCCKEKCQAQVLLFFFVGVDKKMGWACFEMSPTKKKTWGSNPVFWVMLPMPSGSWQSGPLRCDERRRGLLRLLGVCCFKVHPCRIIADLGIAGRDASKEFGGWGGLVSWSPFFAGIFFGRKKQGLGCTSRFFVVFGWLLKYRMLEKWGKHISSSASACS